MCPPKNLHVNVQNSIIQEPESRKNLEVHQLEWIY